MPDIPAADLRALEQCPICAIVYETRDKTIAVAFNTIAVAFNEERAARNVLSYYAGRIYRRAPDTPDGWERVEDE